MAVTNFFDDEKFPFIDGISSVSKPDPFLTQKKKKGTELAEWIKEDLQYLKKLKNHIVILLIGYQLKNKLVEFQNM